MEKTLHLFYEVFCELKTSKELTGEFMEVFVERLLMKKSINLLEVHILSEKLIHKRNIMLMEKEIKKYRKNNKQIITYVKEKEDI